ncbi:MAG: endonuclease III [Chloroflexi bacterium]|nr:endonuclease III [Chloroflexota bacterium]
MLNWVDATLTGAYGEPQLKPQQEPLGELVQTILSQNTADINTARAYAELRRRFPSWYDMMHASVDEIADAIRIGGLAHIKAPRIKAILEQLYAERGSLDLSYLADMPVDEVRRHLTRFHGVGNKTAACVLLFALHMPALPVDTHVLRVSQRLGLVAPKATADQTQAWLEAKLDPARYYPFHLNMIHHGRVCCLARNPRCSSCPLAARCRFLFTSGT